MNDLPWMPFYTADHLADPALRACSLATRGAWMDMLCMMQRDNTDRLVMSVAHLTRALGATPEEIIGVVAELAEAGTADVRAWDDGTDICVTRHALSQACHVEVEIVCRRRSRELEREKNVRNGNRLRKQRQRERQRLERESRSSHAPQSYSQSMLHSSSPGVLARPEMSARKAGRDKDDDVASALIDRIAGAWRAGRIDDLKAYAATALRHDGITPTANRVGAVCDAVVARKQDWRLAGKQLAALSSERSKLLTERSKLQFSVDDPQASDVERAAARRRVEEIDQQIRALSASCRKRQTKSY